MGITLLDDCQQVLERTYRPAGVNLGQCVIGPQRLSQLIEASGIHPEHFSSRAFTFMRPCRDRLYLALYYHPAVINDLESEDPRRSISHRNISSLIDFIEEITHGTHAALAFRDGYRAEMFQSESFACAMEIQARVDTYLLIMRFMARLTGGVPENDVRDWVLDQVMKRDTQNGVPGFLVRRYRLASEIAGRFVVRLRETPGPERSGMIRRFRNAGVWGKWKVTRTRCRNDSGQL
ncbi:MAG: hypothetical protein AAF649_03265 [Verrucomicrobiota bacterium]